jgi:hypothetical protein
MEGMIAKQLSQALASLQNDEHETHPHVFHRPAPPDTGFAFCCFGGGNGGAPTKLSCAPRRYRARVAETELKAFFAMRFFELALDMFGHGFVLFWYVS